MSIRLIAKDLYELHQRVETLEKTLQSAPTEKQPELMDRLRKIRAERDRMRRALDGSKSRSSG
jgi:hypothetical protein